MHSEDVNRAKRRAATLGLALLALVCGFPGRPRAADAEAPASLRRAITDSGFRGGLVAQVGMADPAPALELARAPGVLVHGLTRDPDELAKARDRILETGLYGRVSVSLWRGSSLPYADNTVNLLLVTDGVESIEQPEIERVLTPLGTAIVVRNGVPTTSRKGWPVDVDEWSHSRYDATGNAVSRDRRVGPPRSLRWEAEPRWNRGVKTSSLVSVGGRVFYVLDDSPFYARTQTWSLIARDAFNGVRLWRREIPDWPGARGGKKVGPAQVHRRLVAAGNRVCVTLGESVPVSVLDATTGDPLRTLDGTNPTEEFILSRGIVVALVNPRTPADLRRGLEPAMRIAAADPETGKLLWQHEAGTVLPMSLAADQTQVVYHDGTAIRSLDLATGTPRWTSPPTGQRIETRDNSHPDRPGAEESTIVLAPQFAPTLIVYGDVVAFAGGQQLNVVSADDGRELWRAAYAPSNYSVPVDLFGFGGCLWGPDPDMNLWRPVDDNLDVNAFDPRTGEVKAQVRGDYGYRFQHHRCHQMKVIGNTVVAARAGVEFLDTATGNVTAHHWMRGSCYFGILPANGLLYLPPHDCACYVRAKLSGFLALSADAPPPGPEIPADARLTPGPAYGQTAGRAVAADPGDWPTYRHDPARSGRTGAAAGTDLLLGWEASLPGDLTAPVIAGGRAYAASGATHTLYCLDAASGKSLWTVAFDAPVDSPPTVHEGLVLAGCRDGSVHAIRAADGTPAWRFQAAPRERLIVSRGTPESAWPVHGSVLVANGLAYAAAGRSSYLDGGIRLYGLEPHTGQPKVETVLSTRGDDGSEVLDEDSVEGFLNDILSASDDRLFLRHRVLDPAGNPKAERVTHLHGPDGYLSGETTSRLLWTYAPAYTSPHQGAFYDLRISRMLFPSGRILVEDDELIYGFGQNHYDSPNTEPGGRWALFAAEKKTDVPRDLSAVDYRKLALTGKKTVRFRWWTEVPVHVRAMVKTPDVLYVAGPRGNAFASEAALQGKGDAALLAVSPEDGRVIEEAGLPGMPAWDGMAAAGGSLFITLTDGRVLCLWPTASGRPGTKLSPAGLSVALPPVTVAAEPDLLGRWRFDEGTGTVARDCSGRGHDARIAGRWGTGPFGTCLVTGGSPRAAVIPDAPHMRFGNGDFSLALWVKIDRHGDRLLGKEAFPENWWVINILDAGPAELVLGEGRGPGQTVRARTDSAIPTDAWTHLAVTVDRTARTVTWYVNGERNGEQPVPETMTRGLDGGNADITVPSNHKPFAGLVGDLRIYGRALDAAGVRALFREQAERRADTTVELED